MKIFFFVLMLFMTFTHANVINQVELNELSVDSTWLKLLHYRNGKSSIVDKSFFLDDNGNVSSKKELKKTIEAYFTPFINDNEHPQCRYPARYFWLSKHISLPNYQLIHQKCSNLKKWELLDNTDSISAVFVSGYLGNPASAFGHSFIKINKSGDSSKNLFDTSISYGALLPPNYSMPEYIFNGITGGYEAAYSDKYYYHQDMTYSNQEYRDMWEYRLNLTDDEKKVFLLHAWELMGKKFQYFFLNRNCGYKVSELLELVYNEPIIEQANIFYAPIETFYRLVELDKVRATKKIDKVIYIPSKQQKLYTHYNSLSSNEQNIVKSILDGNLSFIPLDFKEHRLIEKSNALDFVLAYRQYDSPLASNYSLLLSRLKLPMRKERISKPKNKRAITVSNKPSSLSLGIKDGNMGLGWSPFSIDAEGYNDLDGDELVTFETHLSLKDKRLTVTQFDLIRIKRLKTKKIPFSNENPFSWNLHIGMENNFQKDYFLETGGGLAWGLSDKIKLYSMLNISAHTEVGHYRLAPMLGLFSNFNKLRVSTSLAYEKEIEKGNKERVFKIKGQYRLDSDYSFFLNYANERENTLDFGMKWFY